MNDLGKSQGGDEGQFYQSERRRLVAMVDQHIAIVEQQIMVMIENYTEEYCRDVIAALEDWQEIYIGAVRSGNKPFNWIVHRTKERAKAAEIVWKTVTKTLKLFESYVKQPKKYSKSGARDMLLVLRADLDNLLHECQ